MGVFLFSLWVFFRKINFQNFLSLHTEWTFSSLWCDAHHNHITIMQILRWCSSNYMKHYYNVRIQKHSQSWSLRFQIYKIQTIFTTSTSSASLSELSFLLWVSDFVFEFVSHLFYLFLFDLACLVGEKVCESEIILFSFFVVLCSWILSFGFSFSFFSFLVDLSCLICECKVVIYNYVLCWI